MAIVAVRSAGGDRCGPTSSGSARCPWRWNASTGPWSAATCSRPSAPAATSTPPQASWRPPPPTPAPWSSTSSPAGWPTPSGSTAPAEPRTWCPPSSTSCSEPDLLHHRQLHTAGLSGGVVDALGGGAVVAGFGEEDVGHEGLGVAVIEGEPAGLHLHHDAVARQEHVVGRGQGEAVDQGFVRLQGLGRLRAFAVAASEDVRRHHELVAAQVGLAGHLVGVY